MNFTAAHLASSGRSHGAALVSSLFRGPALPREGRVSIFSPTPVCTDMYPGLWEEETANIWGTFESGIRTMKKPEGIGLCVSYVTSVVEGVQEWAELNSGHPRVLP